MSLHNNIDYKLLEQALDCSIICIFDENFLVSYVSENFCFLTGHSKEYFNGKNFFDLIHYNSPKSRSDYSFILDTLKKTETWKGELQLSHIQETGITLDSSIKPVITENKKTAYIACFIETHNRNLLISSLKQRAHQQGLIAILGQLSLNNIPINDLLEQTLAVICGSLEIESGAILEISVSGNSSLVRTSYNTSSLTPAETILEISNNNILSYTLNSETPITCKQIKNESRFSIPEVLLVTEPESIICALIGDKKYPFGILTLISQKNRSLNIDEIHFLQSICNILAEAINRKNMEKALRHEQQLSRKYLDVAEVIFIVLDRNEKIILANHHAASVLGRSQPDLTGISFFDVFISDKDRKQAKEHFHRLLNNEKINSASLNIQKNASPILNSNNQTRYIRWKKSAIYNDNNEVGSVLYSGEDVTDLLAYEKEQKQLEKQLNQAQKMEAIGMLAGGIAHDFNNILASILGFSDLAIETLSKNPAGENNQKLNEYLLQIQTSGIKARDIIAQMQSINLQDDISNKSTLLPSLLKGTLQMLRSALPSSINMQLNIKNNIPAVNINASKFNQVVMHLLTNARNALGGKGNIKIGLYLQKFSDIKCSSCGEKINNEYVVFSIHDNGPGFKNTNISKLFSHNAANNSGLSLVSKLVHESHGHILISDKNISSPGTNIQLLFKIPKQPAAELKTIDLKKPDLNDINNKHIMVVDDENSVATYMGELFRGAGFNVSVFCDSVQALDIFHKTHKNFDLIVTDQTMPVLTGDVLATKMLEIKPDIPIIICSGHNDIFDKNKTDDLNIREYLKKPVDSAELLHTVVSLLATHN